MITYSGEVHVRSEFDRKAVIRFLSDWFLSSGICGQWLENKPCSPFDSYSGTGDFSDTSGGISFSVFDTQACFVMHITCRRPDSSVFSTSCFYYDSDSTFYVGEQLDFMPAGHQDSRSGMDVYASEIMRRIYWNGYNLDLDGSFPDSDRTVFVTKLNFHDMADRLAQHDGIRPCIYLPYRYSGSSQLVEQPFVGQAHVFAESSPLVSECFGSAPEGIKPHKDSLFILYPDGTASDISGMDPDVPADVLSHIHDDFINHVNVRGIDRRFQIQSVKESQLLSRLGSNSELSDIFESLLKEKDSEASALKAECDGLKAQIRDLESKAAALENGYSKQDEPGTKMFASDEKPKYEHEFEDIILKVLEKERNGMKGNADLEHSRKYHVLCDILAHNFPSETGAELERTIRDVFGQGRLTRENIGRLQSAGFSVEKDGRQAHYRISWLDDQRYVTTYAATPSDYRAGLNAASNFANTCFGY